MKSYPVVDLFCGVGGLTHGFYLEGFNIVAGIDSDPFCRYAYEKNNKSKFIEADVSKLTGDFMNGLYPKMGIKILIGCAPCQPFSSYTNKIKEKDQQQWGLLGAFSKIVNEVQPEIISMENVPSLSSKAVFSNFIEALKSNNYYISWSNVYCPNYGVPQQRTRLVLFASKFQKIEMIGSTHKSQNYITVRQAIGQLPQIEINKPNLQDHLHKTGKVSELNYQRILSSKPGGTWRDWDADLLAKCHSKESGHSYYNVYGRMEWDKISPTITTQFTGFGNGRFGHPEQNRPLSLREGALLQTFPANYEFFDPQKGYHFSHVAKHIGNAVPVELAKAIAKSIRNHLESLGI